METFVVRESKGVIHADGRERAYLLSSPEGVDAPNALIIALHGSTQRGSLIRRTSGFNSLVEAHGVVLAYPDAVDGLWRDGRDDDDVDDVAFISELLEELTESLNIAGDKVFVVGVSNGGFMVQRLLCEVPELFCAAASVIATMGLDTFNACFPSQTVSMLLIAAEDDGIVPYEGGLVVRADGGGYRGMTVSFEDAVEFWSTHGDWEVAGEAVSRELEEGVSLLEQDYISDTHGQRLRIVKLAGVGHHWFGRKMPESLEKAFGRTTEQYDVSGEVWRFFEEALTT